MVMFRIPPRYGWLIEKAASEMYPEEYASCKNFIRHKSKLFSPKFLKKAGIPFQTIIQYQGTLG